MAFRGSVCIIFIFLLIGIPTFGDRPCDLEFGWLARRFIVKDTNPKPLARGFLTPYKKTPWRPYHWALMATSLALPLYLYSTGLWNTNFVFWALHQKLLVMPSFMPGLWVANSVFQALPRYLTKRYSADHEPKSLTLGNGIGYNLQTVPIHWLSKWKGKSPHDLRPWVKFVLGGATSIAIVLPALSWGIGETIEATLEESAKEKLAERVKENAVTWEEEIPKDYIYRNVIELLQTDPEAAHIEASNINRQYDAYYQLVSEMKKAESFTPDSKDASGSAPFLELSVFRKLKNYFEKGVPQEAGYAYTADFKPQLEDHQKQALVLLHHQRLLGYQFIKEWVKDKTDTEWIQGFMAPSFRQVLLTLREEGELTDEQFIYYLQEDLDLDLIARENHVIGRYFAVSKDDPRPVDFIEIRRNKMMDEAGDLSFERSNAAKLSSPEPDPVKPSPVPQTEKAAQKPEQAKPKPVSQAKPTATPMAAPKTKQTLN